MNEFKKIAIPFISVIAVFYLVGAFINGTFNSGLWNEVFKTFLASIAIIIAGTVASLYKINDDN